VNAGGGQPPQTEGYGPRGMGERHLLSPPFYPPIKPFLGTLGHALTGGSGLGSARAPRSRSRGAGLGGVNYFSSATRIILSHALQDALFNLLDPAPIYLVDHWNRGNITLLLGDCTKIALPEATALVADPPYGVGHTLRHPEGGRKKGRKEIAGDTETFDPTPWLKYRKVCLFGYPFFASKLPVGSTLVWIKREDKDYGKIMSDCELAWMKGGQGCYCFRHVWCGACRESERGEYYSPAQKPVLLWKWILAKMKLTPTDLVLDPYMGSGSLGLACRDLGLPYCGVEIDPEYFEIAVKRFDR
jgi:site-specific DNA-methyltransferase (adenine-specific)